VIFRDDVAVWKNDEARSERARLAGLRTILAALALALPLIRNLAAEPAKEFLERIDLAPHRDALLGRDIDHRRSKLGSEVRKRRRRSGTRNNGRRRVLSDLRPGLAGEG